MGFDFNIRYGKRKIDLSKGGTWNKPLIICIIIIMIFIGLAVTSKQWLPDECITIEALVESSGENPELYIDEHDIINSKVIFKNSTNR